MKKQYYLTQKGIDELKIEVAELISKRADTADAIKTAREQGDLAENAEYHAAKDEQAVMEHRITEVEYILANSEPISAASSDAVTLGSIVELKPSGSHKAKTFQVVGTVEADPLSGKISDESPIGKALMGKKLGESVEIVTPADTSSYTVSSIK